MKRFLSTMVAVSILLFGSQTVGLPGTMSTVTAEEGIGKKIKSLIVSSQRVSLIKGTEQQLDLKVVYTDNTTELVTDKAEWTSSKPAVVTGDGGKIVEVAPGRATIKAKYEKKETNISVQVT